MLPLTDLIVGQILTKGTTTREQKIVLVEAEVVLASANQLSVTKSCQINLWLKAWETDSDYPEEKEKDTQT